MQPAALMKSSTYKDSHDIDDGRDWTEHLAESLLTLNYKTLGVFNRATVL